MSQSCRLSSAARSVESRIEPLPRPARHSTLRRPRSHRRGGFTLLEVLIATAVTLLMMVSLAQIFKTIGDSMKQGRAALELNNRLRSVALRIRSDLENLTVIPDPPADPSTGTGYLKIFDGSLTDYTAATASLALSRFGDVDDILLATARAGDVWFSGKVPTFVLRGGYTGAPDDLVPVSISSQHAEIVMFVEPIVASTSTALPGVVNTDRNPVYLVANPGFFQDNEANSIPDGYRVHYRTLLIRPDLNLASGILPADTASGVFIAGPQTLRLPDGTTTALASPLFDMAPTHTLSDLSVRRVVNSSDGLPGIADFIAANSLEDLMNPANRFAHIQVPISGTSNSTMPLLALGPANSALYSSEPDGTLGGTGFQVGSGFLHPAYMLHDPAIFYDPDTSVAPVAVLPPSRIGEDILASDILAFDIKGFDPGVPLLLSPGANGTSEAGAAGSDDLVLSPNDPGYASVLGSTPVGTGEFVDLCWGRKTVQQFFALGGTTLPAGANLWGQLSGYSQANYTTAPVGSLPFTNALYKSGLVYQPPGATQLVLQPSYDTWTTSYEGDGLFQAERMGRRGVVVGGSGAPLEGWRNAGGLVVDAGTDGLDNTGSTAGVDDIAEQETSAPFPVKLRGIKISIRMEDPATRQVKQMSVAKEFVSQ